MTVGVAGPGVDAPEGDLDPEERRRLAAYVTDTEGPCFVLRNLPEATKAALFARYSRSSKSLRRLLLDEFLGSATPSGAGSLSGPDAAVGSERARDLFGRVLAEYGDDSVAQLAGVHLACEGVSQLCAKAIEWGRLMAYLEQSTRYVPFTDRPGGRFRYYVDPEIQASPVGAVYREAMDTLFETYASSLEPLRAHLEANLPPEADAGARRRAIRALTLDLARQLLPAATTSNLGIFGSPQAYEQLVMRLRAHPLPEARRWAERIVAQLRPVVGDFLTRLDRPDRGGAWVAYLRDTAAELAATAVRVAPETAGPEAESVRLVEWDGDAELRVAAAALFPYARCATPALLSAVRQLDPGRLDQVFDAAVGERGNRRHRPGRGFEHATYTFDVVSDFGAFRDLQRHRMLTIQWQELTPGLGWSLPPEVEAAGLAQRWRQAVERAEEAWARLRDPFPVQAQYCVTLGHRVRYQIRLDAREAMHLLELRTSPHGHPTYRRLCLEMHRQIAEVAGHRRIAAAMRFVGSGDVHLPRYREELRRKDLPALGNGGWADAPQSIGVSGDVE